MQTDKTRVFFVDIGFKNIIEWVIRFFYASSACIYPEFKQLETNVSLKESDAWPAEVIMSSLKQQQVSV